MWVQQVHRHVFLLLARKYLKLFNYYLVAMLYIIVYVVICLCPIPVL